MYKKKHLKSSAFSLEMLNQILWRIHKQRPGSSASCRLCVGLFYVLTSQHHWHGLTVISEIILCSLSWFTTQWHWLFRICHRIPYYQTDLSCQGRVCVATAGGCFCTGLWPPVSARHMNGRIPGAPERADPVTELCCCRYLVQTSDGFFSVCSGRRHFSSSPKRTATFLTTSSFCPVSSSVTI